jgi:hypothetical protein
MPLPIDQRIKFFVFVIESPSAVDLYHRRSEGDLVRQAVELNAIPCMVKTAISLEAFDACLKVGLSEAMAAHPWFIPLLHISAHGNSDGIQLSNGHVMPWHSLREHLRPVNQALGGSLVVCMSSCEGYMGVRMAMFQEDLELPYHALVGCSDSPTWSETAVAFATLYHQLHRGEHISQAVEAMRVAAGQPSFWLEHAENTRKTYIEFINSSTEPAVAQSNLEQLAAEAPPEDQATLKLMRGES